MVPFNRHGKGGAEQAQSSPSQRRAGSWPGGDGGDTELRTQVGKRGRGKQGTGDASDPPDIWGVRGSQGCGFTCGGHGRGILLPAFWAPLLCPEVVPLPREKKTTAV